MSVLEQDHRIFDDNSVLETVIMGISNYMKLRKKLTFYMKITQTKMQKK